jgi:hypothetical protein
MTETTKGAGRSDAALNPSNDLQEALSVADARALATQDLQPEWRIIEVLAA